MEFYTVNVLRKFYPSQHYYFDSYFNSLTLSMKFPKPRKRQKILYDFNFKRSEYCFERYQFFT